MVSKGCYAKWAGTSQIVPTTSRQEVTYPEDEDKGPIYLKTKSSKKGVESEQTASHHFSFFNKNMQQLLFAYKTKAVLTIQRFYRRRKLKAKANPFQCLFANLLQKRYKKLCTRFYRIIFIRTYAAIVIQRAWRRYFMRIKSCFSTPRRKLLAHTIVVGSRLKKMYSLLESINRNRIMNSPGSQCTITPVKRKKPLMCGLGSEMKFHNRAASMPTVLKDLMSSEPENSCDTIPEMPEMYCPQMAEPPVLDPFPSRNSLVMKQKSVKIRTRRVKKMKTDELFGHLLADSAWNGENREIEVKTCIPKLTEDARFYKKIEFVKVRDKLKKEYLTLVNGWFEKRWN